MCYCINNFLWKYNIPYEKLWSPNISDHLQKFKENRIIYVLFWYSILNFHCIFTHNTIKNVHISTKVLIDLSEHFLSRQKRQKWQICRSMWLPKKKLNIFQHVMTTNFLYCIELTLWISLYEILDILLIFFCCV